MKKFKDWIRLKLKSFLDISSLEGSLDGYVRSNEKTIKEIISSINGIKVGIKLDNDNFYNRLHHNEESLERIHKTIESVVHIGTDVSVNPNYGRSWSVICIEGKMNIVKFVDLNRGNAMDILRFLKQFEAGRHCIDTPYIELFKDGIFKF